MNVNSSVFIPLQQQQEQQKQQQQQQLQQHVAFSGNWRNSCLSSSPPAATTAIAANFARWQHPMAAHFGYYNKHHHQQQQHNFYMQQHYHWSAMNQQQQQQQQQQQKATSLKHQQQQMKKKLVANQTKLETVKKIIKNNSTTTTIATTKKSQATTANVLQTQLETTTAKKNSDDTMQRNGSKAAASSNRKSQQQQSSQHHHHHHQQQQLQRSHKQSNHSTSKQDSTDSGISTAGSHQATKKRRYGRNRHACNVSNNGLNVDVKNGTTTTRVTATATVAAAEVAQSAAATSSSSSFSIKNWLGSEMVFCYENRFESSMAEDNLMPRHNPAHRSSTSSDMGANDDLCSLGGKNKKMTSRQRRHQRRQQLEQQNNQLDGETTPMDIVGSEEKENCCPEQKHNDQNSSDNNNSNSNSKNHAKQQGKMTAANLRKKCTTAAALKQQQQQLMPNNNNNNSNLADSSADDADSILQAAHALSTSASYSSVCSSISSLSSSASSLDGSSLSSSSLSSSASGNSSATSSPAHSTSSSPTGSPSISKRYFLNARKNKSNLSEPELVELLRPYIIQQEMLRVYGFPVESAVYKRCIEIYKCIPKPFNHNGVGVDLQQQQQPHKTPQPDDYQYHQRVKATAMYAKLKNRRSYESTEKTSPYDSSSDSSESGEADGDDEPILTTPSYTDDGIHEILKQYDQSLEKNCMRCKRPFKVSPEGKYLTEETCQYHAGKLVEVYTGKCYEEQFTCCQGGVDSVGCESHAVHVWSGTVVGINGPYTDFEHTKHRYNDRTSVYALDCEMCITGRGLEVTKVTVIGYDGELVYEHFVLPEAPIVDYNTRYSGITAQDLDCSRNEVKTLKQVQRDLLELFDAETILIGHALENDLRALRIVHKTIVDTSIVFPAHHGFPYRRALKTLARIYLYRDIQCSELGHCSLEDSRACLDLMLYRVRHPV